MKILHEFRATLLSEVVAEESDCRITVWIWVGYGVHA